MEGRGIPRRAVTAHKSTRETRNVSLFSSPISNRHPALRISTSPFKHHFAIVQWITREDQARPAVAFLGIGPGKTRVHDSVVVLHPGNEGKCH